MRVAWNRLTSPLPIRDTRVPFTLDVEKDDNGQFFEILLRPDRAEQVRLAVLDIAPKARHLLLQAKWGNESAKYLCGHDERFWFAAAVPESAHASSVVAAQEALKPDAVSDSQLRHQVKAKHRNRRKNAGFIRQGEWFFVPQGQTPYYPE
jgi:hypothetical protein